ncbi:SPX domain-containing protein [Gamsiella multidivaricata]|uniref:SPX domain-containing protein n=1 Tax=Gamsiella multidivaricata TaxID=101098 RepID=UPI00221FE2F6|nr:SPX domain-containing protein [Gamsiella multidivaricata]KAI7823879.1 SPX domain-containing protein [Gamsiella multidivaricata]
MKFAKYLQDEVVPEWRKAYINYKQGKKLLKAIEHALDQLEAEAFIQAENSKLPAYLLDAADLGGRVMSSSDHSPTIQYNPQLSSFSSPSGTTPQTINSSENSPNATTTTSAATPILSRNRGHARNYSTIQISPPPPPASAPVDNDRSGHGGSTLCEHSETTSSSGTTPGHPLKTSKTDSNVSQFSQAARSQGAHLLKHISRRFTIIAPVEAPVRTRTIQVDENDFDSVLEQLLPEEKIFFQFLDSQLEMVNKFYREKELEAVTKLRVVKQQLYVANEWKRRYDEKMVRRK